MIVIWTMVRDLQRRYEMEPGFYFYSLPHWNSKMRIQVFLGNDHELYIRFKEGCCPEKYDDSGFSQFAQLEKADGGRIGEVLIK